MQKITTVLFLLSLLFISNSCVAQNTVEDESNSSNMVDKNATEATKNLFINLHKMAGKGFMFGHQDDLAYGVNWRYESGRSDVKDVVGDYPSLFGWDIGGIERLEANNIDGVPFAEMRKYIQFAYNNGGVNTISWHMRNPKTDSTSWDVSQETVKSILPGGKKHKKFKNWLKQSAKFFKSLKAKDGTPIPILYRPYHELTGNWFWWCQNVTTPEEYKTLWKFTVDYMKEEGVHNLIYVYNTADFNSKEEFLKHYPGDDYVDILSFDKYEYNDPATNNSFVLAMQNQMKIMAETGKERNKLIALGESGYEEVKYANWWTETVMNSIGETPIIFALFWRNHGLTTWDNPPKMHYYVPYKGHPYEADFQSFYRLKNTLFLRDVQKLKLYQK